MSDIRTDCWGDLWGDLWGEGDGVRVVCDDMLDFLFLEDFLGTQCPVVLLRCVPFGHRFVLGLDWFGGLGDALLGDALLGLAGEALVDLMGSHPMGHTIGLVLVLFVRTQRPVFLFLRVPLGHRCDIYNTMILSETRRRRVMIGELWRR